MGDGIQGVTNSSWYMHDFLHNIMNDDLCKHIVYALTFANENPGRYWVPLKGDATHKGFVEMYQSDQSLFAGDSRWTALQDMYGFGPKSGTVGGGGVTPKDGSGSGSHTDIDNDTDADADKGAAVDESAGDGNKNS